MRKLLMLATITLLGAFALSACNKQEPVQPVTQAAIPTTPTSASDVKAWKAYLINVVTNNMQGMTSNRPYLYFVPAGDSEAAESQRDLQLSSVSDTVLRTVLPGNLLAFGGPDSSKTADLIVAAFAKASAGSFKGVIVLFIGSASDQARVADALKPSGATFRFRQM